MAFILADRVKETTITTGTSNLALGGAFGGFRTFSSAIGNGNSTYYGIETSDGNYEVGVGTYTSASNTLSRDTVISSSNSGSKISLTGVSTVFVTQPGTKALFVNPDSYASGVGFTGYAFPDGTVQATSATDGAAPAKLRRSNAGVFFQYFVDNGNDRTVALHMENEELTPQWKMGLKDSPSSQTEAPSYGYVFGENGSAGAYADANNAIYINTNNGFWVVHESASVFNVDKSDGSIFKNGTASTPTLTVRGAAAQSAKLQQWETSAESVVASVDNAGKLICQTLEFGDGTSQTKAANLFQGNNISLLTNDAGYITTHTNISAATSVDNSSPNFIQDITLDSNGHVIGITSAASYNHWRLSDDSSGPFNISDNEELKIAGGDNVTTSYNGTHKTLTITATDTNTTYTAGNGLVLAGTEFSAPDVATASGALRQDITSNTAAVSASGYKISGVLQPQITSKISSSVFYNSGQKYLEERSLLTPLSSFYASGQQHIEKRADISGNLQAQINGISAGAEVYNVASGVVVDNNLYAISGNGGLLDNWNYASGISVSGAISASGYAISGALQAQLANRSNWDTAYGWGNHASAGYLTSQTSHADVVVDGDFSSEGLMKRGGSAGSYSIVTDNSSNWNTAHGWGNHGSAGYLTSETWNYASGVSVSGTFASYAPLANPTFTGTPAAPTASAATNTTQIATTAFVRTEVANLVASAPSALDTLNELAAAINDDASFSTTVTNSIATKIGNVVEDTSPQLGGTLDANSNTIDMGTNTITDTKVGQWDTAYGWGNHASAGYISATLTTEQVQDIVGAMFSGNTETNITATYEDGDGTIDLVSTNTQLSTEEVQDIVGAMFSGNTETNITATYEDGDGTIDLVSTNTTYSAGNGIALSSTTFSVSAGNGLAQDSDGLKLDDPANLTELTEDTDHTSDKILLWDEDASTWKYMTLDNLQDSIDTTGGGGGSGDIEGVTAGDGLSGGGTSGTVSLALDLNELTAASVADGDFIAIIDTNDSNASRKEAVHDLATLFAGAGLTATNSVIAVDTLNQNTTGSAATLTTARNINGVAFDGSANITVPAAGTTLSDTVPVSKGGTGATSLADKAVLITQDTGTDTVSAAVMDANGELLIGGTSGPAVGTLTGGTNVTITNSDGGISIASSDTNTQLSQEQVEDFVGGMLGGTETLITVTYQDGTGDIDFVVDNDLSNYDNSSSGFITATLTEEQVEDFVGGMLGGTETGITVTYQDGTGDIDFVVADTTVAGDSGSTGITPGDTLTIAGGTNVTTAMAGDTLTITATDTNTQLSNEQVQDIAGAMFSSNTETRITATYQDADGTIDLVVDNDLSNYDNSSSGFITATLTTEQVQDIVGAMVGSNTESGITVAYQDADGTLDFTVGTLNQDTAGTAAIATTVTVADESSDTTCFPLFVTTATGDQAPKSGSNLTFNSDTGLLTATSLGGTLTTAAQANVTSLGTLTTLTVDNVIINGTTIGHTDDTDLITLADGVVTVAGEISVTTLDIGGTNVTSTAAELNILDGVTATATELNYLDITTLGTAENSKAFTRKGDGTATFAGTTIADLGTVTTADINGGTIDGVTIGGNSAGAGTFTSITIGSAAINETELEMLDGITAGTAAASKAVVLDGSKNIATIGTIGCGAITSTGSSSFGATSFGDNDITNVGNIALDSITADGSTITITGNTTFADGSYDFDIASHDATNGLKLGGTLVTATAAELNILDGVTSTAAELNILDGVTSTAAELNILDGVTTTAAEINLIDGGTARGTDAIADGDGVLINDGGTMKMTNVTSLATYIRTSAHLGLNAQTDDATIAIALSEGNYFEITLTDDATTTEINITDAVVGQRFIVRFIQPGSGGGDAVLSAGAGFDDVQINSGSRVTVNWPGGTAPTMTTGNGAVDVYGFVIRGIAGSAAIDGFIIGQDVKAPS